MTSVLQWILLFLCPCIWVSAVNITKDPVKKTESTLVILTERNWIEGMGCTGIRGLPNKRENSCREQPPPLGLWKHRKGLKLSEARGLHACLLSHFSHVWLFATPWVVAHQAPFSMGFSKRENWERGRIWYWSGTYSSEKRMPLLWAASDPSEGVWWGWCEYGEELESAASYCHSGGTAPVSATLIGT